MGFGDVCWCLQTPLHSVWGRVVPDIPDFCRELIAALAEDQRALATAVDALWGQQGMSGTQASVETGNEISAATENRAAM